LLPVVADQKGSIMGLKDEGLRAFGFWEPLSHLVRGGYSPPDCRTEDLHAWVHSEEFIRGLKDRGFNLYITSFSKGGGIEAEAADREDTRRVAELCHKHGMYVGAYVRYSTLIPDMMRQEIPDCVERFAARPVWGDYGRYNTQYWRYMPCPTSTEFLEYFDRLIGIAVEDIGIDVLHVDGLALRAEPFACHCERCRAKFLEWLKQRCPSPRSRKERFGYAFEDHLELPDYTTRGRLVLPAPPLSDPVAQEWTLFRCDLLAGIWKAVVRAATRRNPDCLVQGNGSFSPCSSSAQTGMMLSRVADAGNYGFFTEEPGAPDLTPTGRLNGHFGTFKKLRGLGLQIFTYNRGPGARPLTETEEIKRAMAHQMAFNLDAVGVFCAHREVDTWPEAPQEYMAFHAEHRDLFRNAAQAHDVAVYFSERTHAINPGTPIVTDNLVRDVLMRAHVPFGYLLAERRAGMARYRALVLPDVECMTAEEATDIAAYVRDGGGILILGANTGRFDESRRLHRNNVLQQALGIEWSDATNAFTTRPGKGRVAFMRQLLTAEGTPEDLLRIYPRKTALPWLHLEFTKFPHPGNAADMLSSLKWAANGYRFEVTLPDTTVVEFAEQADPARILLHMVNFDLEHDVGPFEISCFGFTPAEAKTLTPDGPAPEIGFVNDKPCAALRVNGFHRYLVAALMQSSVSP